MGNDILYVLDLIGTGVFAITGALAAGRKRMDVFGVIVLACVTALGGGTVRDILLGIRSIFWIADILYLGVAIVMGIATFILARFLAIPYKGLIYADALGLAVFTVVGAQKALLYNHSSFVAVIMGITTAVVGGMARDMLSGEVPMILRQEIYATASLVGALAFIAGIKISGIPSLAALFSIAATLFVRLSAIKWNLSLPLFVSPQDKHA